MPSGRRALLDAAARAAASAYAPYSKLKIGAALRTANGSIHVGCNVENASFGLTCCAERNAIFAAVSAEGGAMRIDELVVVSPLAAGKYRAITPCGACRQVLLEFADGKTRVVYFDGSRLVSVRAKKLLPAAFAFKARQR
jgi:cytidine deaminase